MIEISTRCSEIASKAKRSVTTTASGTSPAGQRLVDPVADEGALERPALDGGQRHLAGEALADEDPEPVAGAEMALALPDAAAGREAGPVLRRHRGSLGPRLPAQQPVGAAGPHLVPGGEVVLGERAQEHPPAAQLQRRVAHALGPRSRSQHLLERTEQGKDVARPGRVAHAADPPDLAGQLAGAGADLDPVACRAAPGGPRPRRPRRAP